MAGQSSSHCRPLVLQPVYLMCWIKLILLHPCFHLFFSVNKNVFLFLPKSGKSALKHDPDATIILSFLLLFFAFLKILIKTSSLKKSIGSSGSLNPSPVVEEISAIFSLKKGALARMESCIDLILLIDSKLSSSNAALASAISFVLFSLLLVALFGVVERPRMASLPV